MKDYHGHAAEICLTEVVKQAESFAHASDMQLISIQPGVNIQYPIVCRVVVGDETRFVYLSQPGLDEFKADMQAGYKRDGKLSCVLESAGIRTLKDLEIALQEAQYVAHVRSAPDQARPVPAYL